MSDTTDDTKAERSLLLRQQLASMLAGASDSVAIGFIDACFSGAAASYRLTNLGAAAEKEGVHVGLLASAQAYQQSFKLSFTRALIDTWKTDCPRNPDDFISAVLGRMEPDGSSPLWLMTYHGSACFGELLSPDKRLLLLWRDPRKNVRVLLFDEQHQASQALRAIPPGDDYVMPYTQALLPGLYRLETRDEEHQDDVLDKGFCDISSQPYCEYIYPATPDEITSLRLTIAGYEGAIALGYSESQLGPLVKDTASLLARIQPGPARSEASKLVASSPALVYAMIQQNVLDGSRLAQQGEHLNEFEKAIEADNKAVAAQQTAQQALERIQTLQSVVANLDTYEVSSELEIPLRPRQGSLTKSEMAALDKLFAPLKSQRGYIIEVRAFSSGSKEIAQARSQDLVESVVRHLVLQYNIPVYRIYAVGMGNASQGIENAKNGREPDRIEVKVLKSLDRPVVAPFADTPSVVPPSAVPPS